MQDDGTMVAVALGAAFMMLEFIRILVRLFSKTVSNKDKLIIDYDKLQERFYKLRQEKDKYKRYAIHYKKERDKYRRVVNILYQKYKALKQELDKHNNPPNN